MHIAELCFGEKEGGLRFLFCLPKRKEKGLNRETKRAKECPLCTKQSSDIFIYSENVMKTFNVGILGLVFLCSCVE